VLADDGEKLQVKARVVSDPAKPGQLQLSPFRSFDFDSAIVVLLSAIDYAVSHRQLLALRQEVRSDFPPGHPTRTGVERLTKRSQRDRREAAVR